MRIESEMGRECMTVHNEWGRTIPAERIKIEGDCLISLSLPLYFLFLFSPRSFSVSHFGCPQASPCGFSFFSLLCFSVILPLFSLLFSSLLFSSFSSFLFS